MDCRNFLLYDDLYDAQQRLRRACSQIAHISRRLEAARFRYSAAAGDENCPLRLVSKNRVMVCEGVLTAYFQYASRKERTIKRIRKILFVEGEEEEEYESEEEDDDA
ncbi:hypothetical protein DPMN_041332 [Dreissena polymorpha]|uniref:Uncharacterized protein n=1 Tax=Dreissena polymorpha TaxID=45954 RepID=A0A9D4CWM5_DREPO|nr:hypothetical protein DPMN_041332 [Dreissena polymorpha]